MEGEEKSKNTDTATKTDKLEDKEFEDGKPFFVEPLTTRGRMPFPRPPPSSNSNPKGNASSNSQSQKTSWK